MNQPPSTRVIALPDESLDLLSATLRPLLHQLANPGNAVMGYAQLLGREAQRLSPASSSQVVGTFAAKIEAEARRSSDWLRAVGHALSDDLDLGVQAEDEKPLASLVRARISKWEAEYPGILFSLDSRNFKPDLSAPAHRGALLAECIEIFARNAAEACAERASKEVRLALENESSGKLVFIIEDDAAGVSGKDLQMLGIPFFTLKSYQNGHLGLGITRAIRLLGKLGHGSMEFQRGDGFFKVRVTLGAKS